MNKHDTSQLDLSAAMLSLGQNARTAARQLASTSTSAKNNALEEAAGAILASTNEIMRINAIELEDGREKGLTSSFLDRLMLDEKRIQAIADALIDIAKLPDPVGTTIAEWDVPSGLHISRVRTPLGVIGVIFESRPNVTADAGALCLKAGNAVILRPGSDSYQTSAAIHACLQQGLEAAGLPVDAIQMVPTTDRAAVGDLLGGLGGNVDVIVPRGGKGLVARVQTEARVPVFAHLEGICHVYIDKAAQLEMAVEVTLNAKMRRTSICGAAETLLIHKDISDSHLLPILEALHTAGCEIRGDDAVCARYDEAIPATQADWTTEYGEPIISVKLVGSVDEAIEHIETHSSHHTEAIITGDDAARNKFFAKVDSAILMHNASTQFADGGEFGMGGEIGIATGKMHARGPVGLEQLTSFKYLVEGQGTIRP